MSGKPLVSFDYAIKYLLKDKGDYEIIEEFISALLKSQGYGEVKIIALLDTESNKEEHMGKRSLADLIVEDVSHHKYIVEIERNIKHTFLHKACFNTSRLIIDHLAQDVDYDEIIKVFHISLLYFPIGNGIIYHGKTIVNEVETKEPLSLQLKNPTTGESFNTVDILPEYFFISIPQFNDRLEKEIDDWLYVMKHDNVPPTAFHSPCMQKVAEKLNILKMTPAERDNYYQYRKKLCDERNELQAAEEIGIAKGEAIGIAKGEAIGIAKGEAIGEDRGMVKMIQKMIANKRSLEEIAEITTMPLDEIKKLIGHV